MKILFITHKFYPDIGGIEVNSEILASAFHKAGHEVRLITWTSNTGEKIYPFTVIRHPSVAVLMKEHRYTNIVFENNPSLRLAWPAIIFRKPSVIALRTWVNRSDKGDAWQDKFKQMWINRSAAVIAVSEAVRKKCWPKAFVIGNPYRQNLFRLLPDIKLKSDFVFMGRLVSDKGAHLAIEALHILTQNEPEKIRQLTIIGSGPQLLELQELVMKFNLSDQVQFTGALSGEQLVECLNKHRYLLVPSIWEEPFGNVALEGMACGCLPIVSNGGGLPDAVGNAGLVVKRGSAQALANGIKTLLSNPLKEQELRDAIPAHLINHHPDTVSGRYLNVIEKAYADCK